MGVILCLLLVLLCLNYSDGITKTNKDIQMLRLKRTAVFLPNKFTRNRLNETMINYTTIYKEEEKSTRSINDESMPIWYRISTTNIELNEEIDGEIISTLNIKKRYAKDDTHFLNSDIIIQNWAANHVNSAKSRHLDSRYIILTYLFVELIFLLSIL